MARNEEKLFGRLNRLFLQKQRDDVAAKNPARPKLSELNSAKELKRWLPTISRDLDLRLQQLEVPCYPQRVIADINGQIVALREEYRAFIHKLKEFEPDYKHQPKDAKYQQRKRKQQDLLRSSDDTMCPSKRANLSAVDTTNSAAPSDINSTTTDSVVAVPCDQELEQRLDLPVLDSDTERQYASEIKHSPVVWNGDLADRPLWTTSSTNTSEECKRSMKHQSGVDSKHSPFMQDCDLATSDRTTSSHHTVEECGQLTDAVNSENCCGFNLLIGAYSELTSSDED